MELLRKQIKHHFLNQIVFRLDYEGLLEKDVEECVFNLRQKFYGADFTHMNRRAENQVDIQVKIDLNVSSDNEYMVSNTNEGWVYIFSSDGNEVIELSKNFFTLTIEVDKEYKTFDKYISLLAESIEFIKNCSPYFRALRMGLRKINVCFLKELNLASSFFTKAAFNVEEIMNQFSGFECTGSNMVTLFVKDGYCINYVRNIQKGAMQQEDGSQEPVYQIALDIDVYRESDKEIRHLLSENKSIETTLREQNKVEFEMFIKSLTDAMIKKMTEDDFECTEILGVN